jgi:hypothetical protein
MGLAFVAFTLCFAVGIGLLLHFFQKPAIFSEATNGSESWRTGYQRPPIPVRSDSVVSTTAKCRELLRCDWRDKDFAQHGDCLTLLEARAGPNRRLVKTFGIDNAFTTIDPEYHKKFLKGVVAQLKTPEEEWAAMSASATDFVRHGLAQGELQISGILLAPMIQTVVLKIVLSKFFPQEAQLDQHAAIETVAACINVLWIDSKTDDAAVEAGAKSRTALSYQKSLRTALKKILPEHDAGVPRRNPLNIILPAYETLWRVVLRCLIETFWRRPSLSSLWIQCFKDFAANGYRFHSDPNNGGSCVAADLVNETLRLYPPTKRVYRWQQAESPHGTPDSEPDLRSADIEALHRSPNETLSRDFPTNFRIDRWVELRRSATGEADSFMPFGYGILACPARVEFAPKIIIVLVGALYTVLRDAKVRLTADDKSDRIPKQLPLETGRDSYMTLRQMSAESGGNDALIEVDDPEERL